MGYNSHTEAEYPISFRAFDAQTLGEHIGTRHSVELVGMKRVGISNFLRFFLYHKNVVKTYISQKEEHLFVPVDLNDLVERELFPFWILTFKRLVDTVEKSKLPQAQRAKIAQLFLNAIQSQDIFMTIEALRNALGMVIANGILPTIFFLRFDRIKDAATIDFFSNLQGLKDSTGQKLAYVFTSFRSLDMLCPEVITRKTLSLFSHLMYLKPARPIDIDIILNSFEKKYAFSPPHSVRENLIRLSGSHVQYLQLALIVLMQKFKNKKNPAEELVHILLSDERITLQSEELAESLTENETKTIKKICLKKNVEGKEKTNSLYLWNTGFITKDLHIFSPLFDTYLCGQGETKQGGSNLDLTKKEHLLFTLLEGNLGIICEREQIISAVWPEIEEFGVSDWTIDRLVARLRSKLKKQNSAYSIITVKTRGYKLIQG